ncbi:U1 zinc finger domain protein [Taphrina deformans PYCC 5710]|uniref:U1 zinc finger domain protein n=1 Tax=Taphrina deformans (strain PYCC 5710 / ATCC 11124 / CBS 356.35 / IMI 108563 / JCM 9778 / NBRC 8474) TaxID=1097556 RepID=R4X8Z6_TAPDE|nr:U1 zinc finger domain protein [Taphrina deformans PYCC 5710]|eukprot:CCG82113.1 U1 zinc finger domain protein [Taphrina deformans PYCC 5710]
MTEYWKSVGNYYCDYCKVFVRNDAFSRKQHEASPRHENSLKRQVRDIHRNSEREARELAQANRELAKIGGKVALPVKPTDEGPKRINIGSRPKKAEKISTLDDQDVYKSALAAQAIPGQWSTSKVIESEAQNDEKHDAKDDTQNAAIDWTEPVPEVEKDETPASLLKRRRDGADLDLIGFKVEAKKTEVLDDDSGDVSAPVSFKQKNSKIADTDSAVKFKKRRVKAVDA